MFRFSALLIILGGLFWTVFGARLALSPPGNPSKEVYRDSVDTMPLLSIGILLIIFGFIIFYRKFASRKGLTKYAFILIQVGGVLYFIGHSLRQFLNGSWEPAAPLGFILLIIGMFLLGWNSIRLKFFPKPIDYLIFIGSVCLLFFNDQLLTAWMSVPFGLIWIVIGARFFLSKQ